MVKLCYIIILEKEISMKLALDIVFYIVLAITAFYLIYYAPRLRAWFYAFKKQKPIINIKQNKFALIIPARDESKVIGCLFDSINNQTYDKNLFDTHILVKNENDATIELSKQVNGNIHIIKEKVCKGHDINVALQKILKECPNKYDAYIIVDADCCLDKKFMEEMNNAMASGKQIIQAKKLVKNKLYKKKGANNWVTNCNGLIWTMIDELGNHYKSDKNIINMTIGTGILLRADVIKELGGWPYDKTLTEDIELMYDCVAKNFSTFYYRPAKVYVEESTSLIETNKRRTRWLTGVIDSKRLYHKTLQQLPKTAKNRKNIYFANALIPVYWLIGTNALASLYFMIMALIFIVFGSPLYIMSFIYGLICFGIIYLSFFVLTAFCLIVDRKTNKMNLREKITTLFVHPLFYMGYIEIIGKALLNQQEKEWKVIERMDLEKEVH